MDQTKRCRYCKIIKPHSDFGRWPDCKDGLHYFCVECWEGFCRQGNAYDKDVLICSKCNKSKLVQEFYRECVFGTRAPWCNSCRTIFIAEHASPKPSKPKNPKPPKFYICQKCRDKKAESEFEIKENGNRYQRCKQCRNQASQQYIILRKSAEDHRQKTLSPRQKRHLHRLQNTGTQICTVCDIEKPLTDFPLDNRKINGVHGTCKECNRSKAKIKSSKRKINEIKNKEITPSDIFQCRKCKQNKSLTEFAKAPGRKEGHDLWCKECSKERKRKWHENHPAPSWEERSAERCNKRARDKGLPFGMKPSDLYDPKTGSLPIFCPYFPEILLDYNHGSDRRRWASVDKIVPILGYVSGNVCVVSNTANTWKSNNSSPEERSRILEIILPKTKTNHRKINDAQKSLFD